MTLTEAKEVCLLAFESKGEILTKRCTPFSPLRKPYAFLPFKINVADLIPASSAV